MNQNELHWSRWRHEESLRIYQNHVNRCANVSACPDLRRQKESASRTRYIKHRRVAESLKRQFEQRRIEKGNRLLEERIASLEIQKGGKQSSIRAGEIGARQTKHPRRRQDPIKTQQLIENNIGLLRRIVSAKPFASRQDWAQERKEMKCYLKRLQRSRDERKGILVQRDELAMAHDKLPSPSKMPTRPKQRKKPAPPKQLCARKMSPKVGNVHRTKTTSKTNAATSASKDVCQRNDKNQPEQLSEISHVKTELRRLEQEFNNLFKKKTPFSGARRLSKGRMKNVSTTSHKVNKNLRGVETPTIPPPIVLRN